MTTATGTQKPCHKCGKTGSTLICDGCRQSFCSKHVTEHRRELSAQIDDIEQQNNKLRYEVNQQSVDMALLSKIDQWENDAIAKIRSTADNARTDLKRLTVESKNQLISVLDKLSNELGSSRTVDSFTENDISRWKKQVHELEKYVKAPSRIELLQDDDSSSLRLIKIENHSKNKNDTRNLSSQRPLHVEEKPNQVVAPSISLRDDHPASKKSDVSIKIDTPSSSQSSSYPSMTFGLNQSKYQDIRSLFDHLMSLPPMDKNGPMSGKCALQTDQMEDFLSQTFGFKNIPGEHIVQGVKAFKLSKPVREMDPNTLIQFPYDIGGSFDTTASEIIEWQRSYAVYTYKYFKEINEDFLSRALQGGSRDGKEAFFMKFVVRISTCPILMEFDAKIISRKLDDGWPTRIKLVSVTGIDFAGRKHDVCDILEYVENWKHVFEVDRAADQPKLRNERDFYRKRDGPAGKLHEDRLLHDLTYMARLRLRACDEEGVKIVVETGIGLGVFSGELIGIDEKVRLTSALAIRTVLEQDGPSYKNIRAVVFALPIFNKTRSHHPIPDAFHAFVDQFEKPEYNGPIPVMIADQDMHRLTVAIARQNFIVSELNPADSHGVFGEYWQNRGPAVEEKLALTTVGLLVQHHLINPYVLNPNNYHFI